MSGRRDPLVRGASTPGKVEFAREQRRQPTPGEEALWRALRGGALGVRFRRQHPIREFVLDFYCAEAQLAVEVDGASHERQEGYDDWRDGELAKLGIRVLRLHEEFVRADLAEALEAIRRALLEGR